MNWRSCWPTMWGARTTTLLIMTSILSTPSTCAAIGRGHPVKRRFETNSGRLENASYQVIRLPIPPDNPSAPARRLPLFVKGEHCPTLQIPQRRAASFLNWLVLSRKILSWSMVSSSLSFMRIRPSTRQVSTSELRAE